MRIAILSRSPKCYSTRRLREAALIRGHDAKVLDTLKFSIFVAEANPDLAYRRKALPPYDAIVPRIGWSITQYGTAVVRQFEQMGVFTLNSSHAISTARDKLRTMQILSRHDIGIPLSAFVKDKEDVLPAIGEVGGAPVVIKLLEGTQGIGVILAETMPAAAAIIETLQSARQNVLIQKFVKESQGRDIRALVVGDEVVAAMRRRARGQEFRSNVHRGGSTEAVALDRVYQRTAVKAAQILGLQVAGVDMLESADGPKVMEVNASPGLEGIEAATRVDVAGAIIEHLGEQAHFPELDLRQRLTLSRGYGIAEFVVTPESELAGKSVEEAQLRERDILVLSINRQELVIPNPHDPQRILPGDVLLCYGKRMTLRTLLPGKQKRRRGKTRPGSRRSSAGAR